MEWKDLVIQSTPEVVKVTRSGKLLWKFQGVMIDPEMVKVVRGILIVPGLEGTWEQAASQTRPFTMHALDPYTGKKLAQARGTFFEGPRFSPPDQRLYFMDFDGKSQAIHGAFTNFYMVVLDPATRHAERWVFKTANLMPAECNPPLNSERDVQHFIPDGYHRGRWQFLYFGTKCSARLSFKDQNEKGRLDSLQKR